MDQADTLPKGVGEQMNRKIASQGKRAPNGASSIYQDKNGKWHGRVTMGVRDDGKTDRRHVESWDRKTVTDKVRKLERARGEGNATQTGTPLDSHRVDRALD